jgi:endonuclease/exonuclease/phosphatase (EEP) superfamily protein YafD
MRTTRWGLVKTLPNYFGVHLSSKLELRDARVHTLTDSRNPSVFASVVLPTGEVVKLYAVHPRPPQLWKGTAERDAQLMAVSLAMRGDVEPHVLLGDLNAVPWEGVVQRTLRLGWVTPALGAASSQPGMRTKFYGNGRWTTSSQGRALRS